MSDVESFQRGLCSRENQEYVERHDLKTTFKLLMKEIILAKPEDPRKYLCNSIEKKLKSKNYRRASNFANDDCGQHDSDPSQSQSPSSVKNELFIVHFNDVYNIEERKKHPCGGAARFLTCINKYRERCLAAIDEEDDCKSSLPLVLFSGDAFSPSVMSTILKGSQMVPILNALGIHTACFGNHDFDFGVDKLKELSDRCTFPWVLSNVTELDGTKLAGSLPSRVFFWGGHKIGVMGLVEKEWVSFLKVKGGEEGNEFGSVGRLLYFPRDLITAPPSILAML